MLNLKINDTMKKLMIYMATAFATLGLNGCSGYLDRDPLNSPSDGTFLANETEMQMALAGCYSYLWTNWETMTFFMGIEEDKDIGKESNKNALEAMEKGADEAKRDIDLSYWSEKYKGISKWK